MSGAPPAATAVPDPHTPYPHNSGTEERPPPACWGAWGSWHGTYPRPPPHATGPRARSGSSTFTSVTSSPQPWLRLWQPGDGHGELGGTRRWGRGTPGPPGRGTEQLVGPGWTPRAAFGTVPEHGRLRAPRRRRSCPAGHSPGHRPASAAPGRSRTWRWRRGSARCRDRRRSRAGCSRGCAPGTRPVFSAKC